MYEPDVILLDEPFSALDVFLKDRLQQELIEMLKDYEGTVIMVSHSKRRNLSFQRGTVDHRLRGNRSFMEKRKKYLRSLYIKRLQN